MLSGLQEDAEANKMEADDFAASLARHCSSVQLQLERLETDLQLATDEQKRLSANLAATQQLHQVFWDADGCQDCACYALAVLAVLTCRFAIMPGLPTDAEAEWQALEHNKSSLDTSLVESRREVEGLNQQITALQKSVVSEKRRALNLILPPDDSRADEKGSVLLVLDMDLQDIKGRELDFIDDVAAHVSYALGVEDDGWISVTSLQSGSIKARLGIGPGPSRSGIRPSEAVDIIKVQADNAASPLRKGALGAQVRGVEATCMHDSESEAGAGAATGSPGAEAVIAVSKKSPARATRTANTQEQPCQDALGLLNMAGEVLSSAVSEPNEHKEAVILDASMASNWSTSTLRESEAAELMAHERSMAERIYSLESLMSEKDKHITGLQDERQAAAAMQHDAMAALRQLERKLDEKESHICTLKSRVQEMEAENDRLQSAPGNAVISLHDTRIARAAVPAQAATAHSTESTSTQLLQFQSTLRKAEAALAEQSTIVEAQAAELGEAHKIIDSAENQKKVMETRLETAFAEVAESREIADSVTVQVEKLSKKNAELTREVAQQHQRAAESKEMNKRLRQELSNALNARRNSSSVGVPSPGDLTLEVDAHRQV